jgi:hypothetical protein
MFDPYQEWFAIAIGSRPLTHYELLALDPEETDPAAIEQTIKARLTQLRPHEKGPHAEDYARLLKELGQAKAVLLNAAKRNAYDLQLHRARTQNRPTTDSTTKTKKASADDTDVDDKPEPKKPRKAKKAAQPAETSNTMTWVLASSAIAVLLVLGGAAIWFLKGHKDSTPPTVAQAPPVVPTAPPAAVPAPAQPAAAPPKPADAPPPAPPALAPKAAVAAPTPPPPPPPMPPRQPTPKVEAPVPKVPVPGDADLARAEKSLRERFKVDYDRAAKDKDRLPLAIKLLQPGREDRNDPAAWFALLREARDQAVLADSARLAVEAIDEIDKWFVVDARDWKFKSLTTVGKSKDDAANRSLVQCLLPLINREIADNHFDEASRLVQLAEDAAAKTKNKDVINLVAARKSELNGFKKEFALVVDALKKLESEPMDGEANLRVGKHRCLVQGRWEDGLAFLSRSNDDTLKPLAQKDREAPFDGLERAKLGTRWFDVGDRLSGRPKALALQRARLWYERAIDVLTGSSRDLVEEQLAQVRRQLPTAFPRLPPGSYYGRGPEDRLLLLREGGGNYRSEEAVERGLAWLAKHQAPNGRWAIDAFHKAGQCNCTEPGQQFDVAGTAFGLLPFLAAGEVQRSSPYLKNVQRGLEFLLKKQNTTDGYFSGNLYENALATIAMCEAYGLMRDARLKQSAQMALDYTVKAQCPDGSWGYNSGAPKGDTSVSGWQFTALKTGYYAQLRVPKTAFISFARFLDSVADTGGLGFGYNAPGAGEATSAVGLLLRVYLGHGPQSPGMEKAIAHLPLPPDDLGLSDKPNMYYFYYATQVMHHYGGPRWQEWNQRLRDKLIDLQDKGEFANHPHQKGSWSPSGAAFAEQGGRLMFTSLAILTLEAYYAHVPLYGYGPAVLQE